MMWPRAIVKTARSGAIVGIVRSGRMDAPVTFDKYGAYLNIVVYWVGQENGKEYVIYAVDVEVEQIESIVVLKLGPHTLRY